MKEEHFAEALKRSTAKGSAGLAEYFTDQAMGTLPLTRERKGARNYALAAVAAAALLVGTGSLASSFYQGRNSEVAAEKALFARSLSLEGWEDTTQIELSAIFEEAEQAALP
jgi:phage-related minor tail protein